MYKLLKGQASESCMFKHAIGVVHQTCVRGYKLWHSEAIWGISGQHVCPQTSRFGVQIPVSALCVGFRMFSSCFGGFFQVLWFPDPLPNLDMCCMLTGTSEMYCYGFTPHTGCPPPCLLSPLGSRIHMVPTTCICGGSSSSHGSGAGLLLGRSRFKLPHHRAATTETSSKALNSLCSRFTVSWLTLCLDPNPQKLGYVKSEFYCAEMQM